MGGLDQGAPAPVLTAWRASRLQGSRPPRRACSASLPGADRGPGRDDREDGRGETGCAPSPPTI